MLTGRLAPSPTGHLHVGHARSFLLAWWSVRARGGRILLRIEDLDVERARPELVDDCLRDLEWLGLDWDGAPVRQSERTDAMHAAAARLVEQERAYPCVCTRREIQSALSAPHGSFEGGELRYPGTCRGRFTSPSAARAETGREPGLRFVTPAGALTLEDAFLGPFEADPDAEVGDFLLVRRDGAVAYQLAVVVDDAAQGVTEVLRGDDLAPSTARQALLAGALGLPRPTWAHVPLVVDDAGERLAKRRGSLTLAALRADGVDARALVAWVARSAGIAAPARVTPAEVAPAFALDALPRCAVHFGAEERKALGAGRDVGAPRFAV